VVKQIGDIKLYSVEDLHEALKVNERTIRDWFNKGRLRGQKIGTEWHITEENLRRFLSGEEGGEKKRELRALKKKKTKKKGGMIK
jgi:excisionase family DNA binding protein